jgi:tetratricopeptide (TPR) repeat protein
VAAGILVVGSARYFSGGATTVEPPTLPLEGVDPAVVQAIESARGKVLQTPRSANAWGRLGMVLGAYHYFDEANTCFAQAEKLDPSEPRWPYFQGGILSLHDQEAAVPKLRRAAQLCAGDPDAPGLLLGDMLMKLDRADEAEEPFRQVLQKNPANARARLQLGRLLYLRGDLQKALEQLRHAAENQYTRQAAHQLMAEVYQRQGDPQAAEEHRQRTYQLPPDPSWPSTYDAEVKSLEVGEQANVKHVRQLLNQGRVPEAVALLEKTVRAYPDSLSAWELLGDTLVKTGTQLDRAEQALERAAQLGSTAALVLHGRGVIRLLLADWQGALVYFRQALARKPDFALTHFCIGRCLDEQGDRAGALKAFETALRCKPDLVQARKASAGLLIREGKYGLALQHLGYALKLAPTDEQSRQLLRQALQRITLPVAL